MREALADLCHRQWSGWLDYMFSKCEYIDGNFVIPAIFVERWRRQMTTPYKKLPEDEKESDRQEADKFIRVMGDFMDG